MNASPAPTVSTIFDGCGGQVASLAGRAEERGAVGAASQGNNFQIIRSESN